MRGGTFCMPKCTMNAFEAYIEKNVADFFSQASTVKTR